MKQIILTACLTLCAIHFSEADDIFASPANAKAKDAIIYPTSAALLAATEKGEVSGFIVANRNNLDVIGRSVVAILRVENEVSSADSFDYTVSRCGLFYSELTDYELGGGKAKYYASLCKQDRGYLAANAQNPKFMAAFDSLAKNYAIALREFIAKKQEADAGVVAIETEKQRQADMLERRKQEERQMISARADAQAASKKAADDAQEASRLTEEKIRTAAVAGAMDAQANAQEQKRQEILNSPAFKLWIMSLQIEEGLKLQKTGQDDLDHEDAVQRESGVVNLTARNAAGERIVAGKRLVKESFAAYRKLGGTSLTPDEVRAGPNPTDKIDY